MISKSKYSKCARYITNYIIKHYGEKKYGNRLVWDHKYSINRGYNFNIPIVVISNPNNLRITSATINTKKKTGCIITVTELFDGFHEWVAIDPSTYQKVSERIRKLTV